jgi:signal transduction histidine kinase
MESPEMESLFAPFAFPSRIPYIYRRKPNPPALNAIRRFIKTVPSWAFMLVLLVIAVNIIYLVNMYRMIFIDAEYRFTDGKCIIYEISAVGPAKRAGLQPGDIVLAIDSISILNPENLSSDVGLYEIGDTLTYRILRNNEVLTAIRIPSSYMQEAPVLYYIKHLLIMLFSCTCLYLLYKKPGDRSVTLFFIYFQVYAISHSAYYLFQTDLFTNFATVIFFYSTYLSSAVIVHFTLVFPQPSMIIRRYKWLPVIFYGTGSVLASFFSTCYLLAIYSPSSKGGDLLDSLNRTHSSWIGVTCCIAIAIAIYQFRTIKNTIARNQIRMMIIGAFFGYSMPMAYAVFYDELLHLDFLYPFIFYDLAGLVTIFIMLICFMTALLRYRIWDIELYIKKALLYLGATLLIITTYLLLIFLVNQMTEGGSDTFRFLSLAVSVIIFLVLRDRLQQLIDRLFHRESYDSATVVADFEEKLSGVYRIEDLGYRILDGLDDIFHFRSFVLCLKEGSFSYNPAFSIGPLQENNPGKFVINQEFAKKLSKSKVFSVAELNEKPDYLDLSEVEFIVPMVKSNEPFGFFLCGPKKSEKSYSIQDLRVLTLVAKRVIALFQTAALYQKDLDRQLMLERERARISQDMHDDVGASLTRISMMSDLVRNMTDIREDARQWLGQISGTSRGVMEEMNQIIWALNPKNDNLEGLVTYIRRFAFEYLEPASLECVFELPEEMPDRALSVEVRRNVYLVVREALHNVVKHSGAKKVQISLMMNENGFRIRIKDDGRGFDPVKLEFPGNGLVNMKKRMNDIGGEIMIRSIVGEGTEIELVMII